MPSDPNDLRWSWKSRGKRSRRPEPDRYFDELDAAEALILLANCDGGFCPRSPTTATTRFITSLLPTTSSLIVQQPTAAAVASRKREPDVSPDTPLKAAAYQYVCLECGRRFQSYQALGGHMTSHRPKPQTTTLSDDGNSSAARIHECSYCHEIFPSGQALGGHKRKHYHGPLIARKPANSPSSSSCTGRDDGGAASRPKIDLNLPPPEESDTE